MDYKVVALKIGNRDGSALEIQKILTKHGCLIKVRLGLHDQPANSCSPAGLVLMEVEGEDAEIKAMVAELNAVPETSAKYLSI